MSAKTDPPAEERIAELADGLLVDPTVELDDVAEVDGEVAPVVPLGERTAVCADSDADADSDGLVCSGPTEPSVEGTPDDSDGGEIDPRIRARRIAIRRAEGRRRLRRLIAVAVSVVAGLLGWSVTRSPLLDVDRVAVTGATRTPPDAIVQAARVPSHQAMTDVDLGAIEARVDELPWVADVDATRHWPSTVVVRVEERQPVALAPAEAGGWAVLSADGRIMEIVAEAPAGLVPLVDVPAVGEATAELAPVTLDALAVARLIPASLLARVAAVAPVEAAADAEEGAVGPGEMELRLNPAGVVRLGSLDDLPAKIVAMAAVLADAAEWCIGQLDVEVPRAPVLTRRPECA